MTIKYRLFMRKIKGDCDVIAYPDVVFDAKKQKQNKQTNKQTEKDFKNTKKNKLADGADSKAIPTAFSLQPHG